jgi:ribosomal-protein-alanine N-acetyltransferase
MTGRLPGFKTSRLYLRGLELGDEDFLVQLDTDPLVMRYIHDGTLGLDEAASWARMQVDAHVSPRFHRRFGKWMVELPGLPTRIGWVEASKLSLSAGDFRCVGYEFATEYWGRGYATEAVISVVDYLFGRLKEENVVAYTRPDNMRSVRVLQKAGFRFAGQHVHDGGHHLCDVYQISVSEWKEPQQPWRT